MNPSPTPVRVCFEFITVLYLCSCFPSLPAGLQMVENVLHYSEGDLVRRTGLLLGEVRALVQLASEAVLPSPALCPALDLYVREKELPRWGR